MNVCILLIFNQYEQEQEVTTFENERGNAGNKTDISDSFVQRDLANQNHFGIFQIRNDLKEANISISNQGDCNSVYFDLGISSCQLQSLKKSTDLNSSCQHHSDSDKALHKSFDLNSSYQQQCDSEKSIDLDSACQFQSASNKSLEKSIDLDSSLQQQTDNVKEFINIPDENLSNNSLKHVTDVQLNSTINEVSFSKRDIYICIYIYIYII